jgi:hypothetical protein
VNNEAVERSRVIRYLLGQLQEIETADLEQRRAGDPAYADFCNDAEDELIESYLQGQLSAEDTDRFKRYYLNSPERERKVEFTRALLTSFSRTRNRSALWNALGGAGAALALVAVAWLLLRPYQTSIVSFSLAPGVVRSLGTPTILNVPRGALLIEFHLEPENALKGHRVILRSEDLQEEIWSQRIKPSPDGRFDLQIPSTILQSGDYILTLQNNSEVIASYFFRLAK